VCTLMQFKKSRTHRQTDRKTHTQTHRAYKELQVPPFNLTVNVGNDNNNNEKFILRLKMPRKFKGAFFCTSAKFAHRQNA